ncbi:MAG: hypothetical protein ACK5GU_07750 [Chloroflexota bacterium]|jgi:hypothetical protein
MLKYLYHALIIIGVAIMIALIAEGAMLFMDVPTPDITRALPDTDHVEPTGPITAARMLLTLAQTAIVATIVIKFGQHNQQKRRAQKQQVTR